MQQDSLLTQKHSNQKRLTTEGLSKQLPALMIETNCLMQRLYNAYQCQIKPPEVVTSPCLLIYYGKAEENTSYSNWLKNVNKQKTFFIYDFQKMT